MDYIKIYNRLIDRSISEDRCKYKKSDVRYVYYESHHIIPRCLGGTDEASNLALLLPEEHYVAHQLLIKIHPNNYKLLAAITKMSGNSSKNHNRKFNNKMYSWIKNRFSKLDMPAEHKGSISKSLRGRKKTPTHIKNIVQSRIDNNNYNHTPESKKNISTALSKLKWYNNGKDNIRISGNPEEDYVKGRLAFLITPAKKGIKITADLTDKSEIIFSKSSHGNAGNKNTSWKGYVHTPDGIFESSMLAAKYYNLTDTTIRNRCRSSNLKFTDWILITK